jgi:hypothetical protein
VPLEGRVLARANLFNASLFFHYYSETRERCAVFSEQTEHSLIWPEQMAAKTDWGRSKDVGTPEFDVCT